MNLFHLFDMKTSVQKSHTPVMVRFVFPKKSTRREKIINRSKAGVFHMFIKIWTWQVQSLSPWSVSTISINADNC